MWVSHVTNMPSTMREIALRPSTNKSITIYLVLAGSRSSFTEITEYRYFRLLKPSREFRNRVSRNRVRWVHFGTFGPHYVTHFVFVKYDIYILLCVCVCVCVLLDECSATQQFLTYIHLHSWVHRVTPIFEICSYSPSSHIWVCRVIHMVG